jgi:3-methyl-2-oxobutanoate hydroxymethyltransferase
MLPQRVIEEGGYHIKGKSPAEAERLLADALAIDLAGASAIVLELVHAPLAAAISAKIACPSIGIGSGLECDGGILVLHDLIGLFPWFRPKFAIPRADVASAIQQAAREYAADIKNSPARSV